MKFYQLDSAVLEKELQTDLERGLTHEQAQARLRECGYNTQYPKMKFSLKSQEYIFIVLYLLIAVTYLIFALFRKDLNYVFYAIAAVAVLVVCQLGLFAVKFVIDKAMYRSSYNNPYTVTVMRDGVKVKVKYTEVMYGDIVYLEKGDYIPFDGVILSSNGLVTDESSVTGNDRVSKHSGIIPNDNVKASELYNTVFCGSYVIHGKATVVVTEVCSRVYIVKSGKNNNSKFRFTSKIVDMSTLFTAIFDLFCIIFTVICGLISKDAVGIITAIILFISVLVSGFIKTIATLVFKKAFLNLNKKGIILKDISEIETLNNSDVLLLNHNMIFEKKVEFSGFISDNMECKPLSAISKNNFGVFLYAAFCCDLNTSVSKACVKILKKLGIDFTDINSICPVFSRSTDENTGVTISARSYEGNNMLIATGNYNIIKSMCDSHVPESVLSELNAISTEMIAVAIKNVDVIPDDPTVQAFGFTLVGVLGINRKLEKRVVNSCKILKKCGVHPIILFPGNKAAANSVVGSNVRCLSFEDLNNETVKNISDYSLLCDYDGDIQKTVTLLSENEHLPVYCGDKVLRDKKSIAFKFDDLSAYDSKDADIVSPGGFDSICSAIMEAKKAYYVINSSFENFGLFAAFYVVCGVLFSLLFKSIMVPTLASALVVFMVLPAVSLISLWCDVSVKEIARGNHTNDPLHNKSISLGIITSILFLIVCVFVKFLCPVQIASPFIFLTFVTYICVSTDNLKKSPAFFALRLVPALAVCVLMLLPLSFVFGCESFGVLSAFIATVLGVILKFIAKFICRSVKI